MEVHLVDFEEFKNTIQNLVATDSQYEELIDILQGKVKHSRVEREVLQVIKKDRIENPELPMVENADELKFIFFELEFESELQSWHNFWNTIDWQWVYEELKK